METLPMEVSGRGSTIKRGFPQTSAAAVWRFDPCLASASFAIDTTLATTMIIRRSAESPPQPRIYLVVEPIPLVDTSTPGLVVVQDIPLAISNLPEGVKRSFFLLRNSANAEGQTVRRRRRSPVAVHGTNRIDDTIALA
jgi:hypothetical protein